MRGLSLAGWLAGAFVVGACHPPGWGRDPEVDAAPADAGSGDGEAATDGGDLDAGDDAAAACAHTFRLEGFGSAGEALVTGDFVQWVGTAAEGAVAMTLGQDTAWTGGRMLSPGVYQYRFIVDGVWMEDPANPDRVDNGLGGYNSIVRCP
jgi:hypothetical protein